MQKHGSVNIYFTHLWNKGRCERMKLYKYTDDRANVSGLKIKELRVSAGLSQEQLAAKLQLHGLNLNQKAVSRIETGDRVVPDFELLFFSKIFNVSVCFLLSKEH